MTRTGIVWRALTGAPEPALEYCAARARAIEAEVSRLAKHIPQANGEPICLQKMDRPSC